MISLSTFNNLWSNLMSYFCNTRRAPLRNRVRSHDVAVWTNPLLSSNFMQKAQAKMPGL